MHMPDIFEITHRDSAGRIGRLTTPHGVVETPAIMPVINPNIQTIPSKEMKDFGARILITNSYIIYRKPGLKQRAVDEGVHALLGFDGPVMTDSGSFQLSVYGQVEVDNAEIIGFQHAIGTDIGVPLDIPTSPAADHQQAAQELAITNKRLMEALELNRCSGMLLAAPVQGGIHTDLREQAGRKLGRAGFDIYPIGAVVPLMESYRYAELVDVIVSAKKGLPSSVPVHLFGAGHPMVFALATALGCDLFDSAAYALYARDDRYLTAEGTFHIRDLKYLPCSCPICSSHTPSEIISSTDRTELLARHNLFATFAEMKLVKQAIYDGNLWELVERRARIHPRMLDGLKRAVTHAAWLEQFDPSTKSTFFYCGPESTYRPEVLRWGSRLERLELTGIVLIRPGGRLKNESEYDTVLHFKPPFGAYPLELKETYPLNAEVPDVADYESMTNALLNTKKLIQLNPDAEFSFVYRTSWDHPLVEEICQMASHSWSV